MHGHRCLVALALVTTTMQVCVVNTSISTYSLLSAYFLTTYTCKRMHLMTRAYGIVGFHRYGHILLELCQYFMVTYYLSFTNILEINIQHSIICVPTLAENYRLFSIIR